jgi:hypothetical protein
MQKKEHGGKFWSMCFGEMEIKGSLDCWKPTKKVQMSKEQQDVSINLKKVKSKAIPYQALKAYRVVRC